MALLSLSKLYALCIVYECALILGLLCGKGLIVKAFVAVFCIEYMEVDHTLFVLLLRVT